MGEFHLVHWIVVLSVLAVLGSVWSYPLAVLCRRTGKPPAVAWFAGTVGFFFGGPMWCVWWLAFSDWNPPSSKP
jgi:hypothetical protein